MLPDTVTELNAYLANSIKCATSSVIKHIMAFAEEMQTYIDTLPDDLKPYGEAITKFSMEVLIGSYAERLQLISEEITRVAIPPEQQTEQESLNRRSSDEI
jgi:hypothetical protein